MRDAEKIIGNLIDKQDVSFIASTDSDTMYYPGGVTDPEYCVLKFKAQSGRYYANFKSEDFEI